MFYWPNKTTHTGQIWSVDPWSAVSDLRPDCHLAWQCQLIGQQRCAISKVHLHSPSTVISQFVQKPLPSVYQCLWLRRIVYWPVLSFDSHWKFCQLQIGGNPIGHRWELSPWHTQATVLPGLYIIGFAPKEEGAYPWYYLRQHWIQFWITWFKKKNAAPVLPPKCFEITGWMVLLIREVRYPGS